MARIRVALLGAGAMGSIMARDIYPRVADEVEVVAVIDRHPDRCGPLAHGLGARAFPSLAEAMNAVDIDAVDIRLQHSAHAEATLEALAAGLHVLVEKPLAVSLEECEAMIKAAREADRVVAIAENYPHLRSVQAAQLAMAAGDIGDVLTLRTTRAYTLDGVWANTTWRQGTGPIAGILWDQGTHHTSMIRALAGDVRAVSAAASRVNVPGAEVVALTLEMESGLVAQSTYCWGTPAVDSDVEAMVLGSGGRIDIRVDYDGDLGGATVVTPDAEQRSLGAPEGYYDSHRLIVLDWIQAIRGAGAARVDLLSATADVRVVLAAQRSLAEAGAFIDLDSVTS